MKKIIWLFVIMIIITGCKKEEKQEIIKKESTEEEIIEEKEIYVDNNPIKIAFYSGNGPYKKLTNYSSSYGEYKEIGVLEDENAIVIPFEYFNDENTDKLKEIILRMYEVMDAPIEYKENEELQNGYNRIFT